MERRTNPPNARGRVPVEGGWKRTGKGGERKLRRKKECGRPARHAQRNVHNDNDTDNHYQLQHEMEHEHESQHGCYGTTAVRERQLGTWKRVGSQGAQGVQVRMGPPRHAHHDIHNGGTDHNEQPQHWHGHHHRGDNGGGATTMREQQGGERGGTWVENLRTHTGVDRTPCIPTIY